MTVHPVNDKPLTDLQREYSLSDEAIKKFASRVQNFRGLRMGRDRHRTVVGPDLFTVRQALQYVFDTGMNSRCYLTGRMVDVNDPYSYSLDHILPVYKGGTCTLHNLGVTTPDANLAKVHLTPFEFGELCADVLARMGYTVIGGVSNDHNRLDIGLALSIQ